MHHKTLTLADTKDVFADDVQPAICELLSPLVAHPARTEIQALSLAGVHCNAAAAAQLAQCMRVLPHLRALRVSDAGLTDAACSAIIAALQSLPDLRSLDLSRNRLTGAAAVVLNASRPRNSALTLLSLAQNDLGSAGVDNAAALAAYLPTLAVLDLGQTTDADPFTALAAALPEPRQQLRQLRVGPVLATISSQALVVLLARQPQLTSVTITGRLQSSTDLMNQVNSDALAALCGPSGLQDLQDLRVQATTIVVQDQLHSRRLTSLVLLGRLRLSHDRNEGVWLWLSATNFLQLQKLHLGVLDFDTAQMKLAWLGRF